MGIFRAYDIRGEVPEDLGPGKAKGIGRAIGTYLQKQGRREVLIGRDVRIHSKNIEKAVIRGLKETGVEVYKVGEQPFGILFFGIEKHDLDALVYITGSHLGPEWNGIKLLYSKGLAPSKEEIKNIEHIYDGKKFKKGEGGEHRISGLRGDYIKNAREKFDLSGLKILMDCFNGASALVAPKLFRALGADLKVLYKEVNGNFPNKNPVPKEENLKEMKRKMEDFDLGIAYDGDGDRAVFIDNKGRVLSPSQIGAFLVEGLGKGKIVTNVGCSMLLEKNFGEERVKRIPVGHTYLAKYCRKEDAVIGLESSSHYIIPGLSKFDDAILVSVQVADRLAKTGKKASEIWKKYEPFPKTQINFHCPDDKKFDIVDKLKKRFSKKYDNTLTIDGVRVSFEDSWFLIRASNTSPKIRLYIEAKNKDRMDQLGDEIGSTLGEEIEEETGSSVKLDRGSE